MIKQNVLRKDAITITYIFQMKMKSRAQKHYRNMPDRGCIVKYIQKKYKIIVKNPLFTRTFHECIILIENMKSITDFIEGKERYYGLQKDRAGNSG